MVRSKTAVGDFPIGFGRYQLVERLAVGGMAELFVAAAPGEHGFQKKVVIKRLLPHLVEDSTYNAMFIDEAKLTARLVHPKIAQTFELGKVDDALFIAMEYIDGIDVLALLREYASQRRRIEPQLAAWIAHEVLDALDYAHNQTGEDGARLAIVHRDISPSNVLLSIRGDIKLVDFGIARQQDPERAHKSKSGTLKGKYGYMSPEQVIEQSLDARSDLFSVGVVLAELLTGRRLFAAANELDVLLMVRDAKLGRFEKYGADIAPDLADIVRKALKKSVNERWQSAAQFRDAISEWLFEHRHRMTSKNVADVVAELRDLVIERRNRTVNAGTSVLDDIAVNRPQGEEASPVVVSDAEQSMPLISVSYEQGQGPESAIPSRPLAVSDLAMHVSQPRAATVQPRPGTRPMAVPAVAMLPAVPPPVPSSLVVNRPGAPPRPRPPTSAPGLPDAGEHDNIVEVPIADTISAAVEAITLPVPDLASGPTDDSAMRAFDDLDAERQARESRFSIEDDFDRKKSPPPGLSDIPDPPDDSGDFSTTSPVRVLFRLMIARATGLLLVSVGGIRKEIYVRDGQPEYVSSNVASELFGNYLVNKGVLSDGELAMALAMMPHYGGKLGDTLVGLGLLKPLEVFRHLTRQIRTKIIDVCTWNKGSFGWYAGRENPREAFPLDFNAFEILGAAAMALSDEVVESWIARNAALRLRASRTRRIGPERFEVKGLVEMCDMLDGRRAVSDLVETSSDRTERLNLGRMLCLLEACDLARPS
ncbi:MAG TPA: serine/threonine-protein kinase [Kofleriaceae bacterium]|jgi:serine/threonine protein kinase|nr:serine/threonine-protein kinase [Kofleriaceae bacterium]